MPSRRRPVIHNTPPIVQPNPSDHKCPVDGSFANDTRCHRGNHGTHSSTSSFRLQPGTPDPQRTSSSYSLRQRCPPQITLTIQFTNPHVTLRPALSGLRAIVLARQSKTSPIVTNDPSTH
ncbi:hypothetical protein BLNAU_4286 [Blattamonas nauphoetae]|uniref:Uncharacterized protein n=1 Tax=Blattamonas nauphoetae TaxID=2049346 RepID=A0ABQ9YBA1_9EUKA|nr:hypothetical protein BLNAU_4286 [Blattamonas nauphoetae]